jgi:predicted DNA-binding protein
MPRSSVIPAVRERLEKYLELIEEQYLAQDEALRCPTLPHTNDSKANVSAIAEAQLICCD